MKKIILLTNVLTPYRRYFYDLLYQECRTKDIDFKVLITAKEQPNNNIWSYDSLKAEYTYLIKGKVFTVSNLYIHINIGLSKFVKENKPDLIVSAGTYLYPALWTVLKQKAKLNYKVYYWNESHLHERREYGNIKLKIREKIRSIIFKQFDGFWFAGKLSLELIEKYASPDSKKIFVPNIVDNQLYKSVINRTDNDKELVRKKFNISKKEVVMVCPARLTWVKGHLDFLNIFIKSPVASKFTILLLGNGDLENEISDFISLYCDIDIRLLGYKNQTEMLDIYSVSNFLLLPSLSDCNPLTSIEALWCGLPLLVSNHVGNHPEVIQECENGYVFNYSDENEILKIIEEISNKNSEWYKNAANVSLSIARNIYDSELASKRIIHELINQNI